MTWVDLAPDTGYGLSNLPYGIFSTGGTSRTGIAVGEHVLDLAGVTGNPVHATGSLNAFLSGGPGAWASLRAEVTGWLTDDGHRARVQPHLVPMAEVTMHLPIDVADYVDFYSSEQHAANVGAIFRPGSDPLPPNWKHLPIGYSGRAGTVAVSGTPVVRPSGQRLEGGTPVFGPSTRLDLEAELGFVVGAPSDRPVPVNAFSDHVFGVCLLNDWSARDVQAWEYVPLGPFLGKSFLTSISPWVVPLAALEAARVAPPPRDPEPLPYLRDDEPWGLDISLELRLNGELVSRPPAAGLYWTAAQQLAHLTVNGATLRTGDLYGSGTVSGPARDQRGSLLELSWGGAEPLTLADGSTRTFLEDGDVVTLTASAPGPDGTRISFGEVTGQVYPAR